MLQNSVVSRTTLSCWDPSLDASTTSDPGFQLREKSRISRNRDRIARKAIRKLGNLAQGNKKASKLRGSKTKVHPLPGVLNLLCSLLVDPCLLMIHVYSSTPPREDVFLTIFYLPKGEDEIMLEETGDEKMYRKRKGAKLMKAAKRGDERGVKHVLKTTLRKHLRHLPCDEAFIECVRQHSNMSTATILLPWLQFRTVLKVSHTHSHTNNSLHLSSMCLTVCMKGLQIGIDRTFPPVIMTCLTATRGFVMHELDESMLVKTPLTTLLLENKGRKIDERPSTAPEQSLNASAFASEARREHEERPPQPLMFYLIKALPQAMGGPQLVLTNLLNIAIESDHLPLTELVTEMMLDPEMLVDQVRLVDPVSV